MLIKRYSICLVSVLNLCELFLTFIYANDIISLVNSLFRVKNFNPFPSFNYSSLTVIYYIHHLFGATHDIYNR